jgi:hypothetical protein
MDYEAEQSMEIEALQAILMEEFQGVTMQNHIVIQGFYKRLGVPKH